MPNIKSAKKRVRVSAVKQERNKAKKSELKTVLKKAAAEDSVKSDLAFAIKKLDIAVGKGIIHKNKAARLKGRLAKKINASA